MNEVYAHIYRFTNFGMREIHKGVTDDDFITLGQAKELLSEANRCGYERGKQDTKGEANAKTNA